MTTFYAHRRTTPNVRKAIQVTRALAYGMFIGAGVSMMLIGFPPYSGWSQAMALLCVVGGTLCLAGQLFDRWMGELLGLPLLGTAMVALAVLTGLETDWDYMSGPTILLLTGFGTLLAMRWVDLSLLARANRIVSNLEG